MKKQNSYKAFSLYSFALCLMMMCSFKPTDSQASTAVSVVCETAVNIALGTDGTATITPAAVAEILGNPADLDFITVTPNTFDCSDIGAGTVTVNWAIDGLSDQCIVAVQIEDKQPPIIACASVVNISLDNDGVVELLGGFFLEFIADNCNTTTTVSPATVSCSDIGTPVPVTITVTDDGGNSVSCSSTAIVEDKTPFIAVCNAFVNVALDFDGVVELEGDLLAEGTNDNCPLTTTVSPASVSCADIGTPVMAVVTITDINGNTNSCFSTVTVEDKLGAVAVCEANITLDLAGAPSATLSASDVDAGSFDNCGIADLSLSQTVFTTADLGTNMVVMTVTDIAGNVNSCFSTVEVINSAYCDSRGTNTNKEFIQRIKFAGINARTGDNDGYLDNTGEVGDVIPGDSYRITLKPKFPANNKKEFWRVWIDWNQNQLFESSELMLQTSSKEKVVAFISVPASAPAGVTRMRIAMQRGAYADACEVFTRGEVEDYSVNVLPPAPPMVVLPSGNDPQAQSSTLSSLSKSTSESMIRLSPNPAREIIRIELGEEWAERAQWQLYNTLGQSIDAGWLSDLGDRRELNIAALQPGTYWLRIESSAGRELLPFVKL